MRWAWRRSARSGRGWVLAGLLVAAISVLWRLDRPDATFDAHGTPVEVARQIAARHTHGWDDQLPVDELDALAAKRPIRSTCGYVSAWGARVLEREGHEARVVDTLTLDGWDDRNNGHTMVEARVDGEWVLFDVDRDVWFWLDSAPLSLIGFVDAVAAGAPYEVRPLSGDPIDEAAIRADDRRLMQAPGVRTSEGTVFFSSDPGRVAAYSDAYRLVDEDEWRERFYR